MTVNVSKPAINVREKLAELDKPTGIAGEAMLRAETPQEQFNLIGAGRRNMLFNGNMRFNQRDGGVVNPTTYMYGLDRWFYSGHQSSNNYYTMEQSTDAPEGFTNSLLITSTTSSSPDGLYYVRQGLEGYDIAHLDYGTQNAKSVTLSFWVKGSVAGDYGVIFHNWNPPTYVHYTTTYTVNSPNTWEYKTITISGETSTVPVIDNSATLYVAFTFGANTQAAASNSWQSGAKHNVGGICDFLGTNGATLHITGTQLEVGKVATPFEHRSYGEELALCQRYYWRPPSGTQFFAYQYQPDYRMAQVRMPVEMRSTPTVTYSTTGGSGWSTYNHNNTHIGYYAAAANTLASNVYIYNLKCDAEL